MIECEKKKKNLGKKKKYYILQGINYEGKSVYIDEVPNGKNCKCHCAECGGELIAKQGKIKVHHFAHANGNDSIKCSQTALHLLAKEIITKEKRIPIPRNGKIEFYQADRIEQEKFMGDIIPDLYAICENRPFIVEVLVTHEVDDKKTEKIKGHHISAVEIDLSDKIFESIDDVKAALYDLNNIKILYSDDKRLIIERMQILLDYGLKLPVYRDGVVPCPKARKGVLLSFCRSCVFCYYEKGHHVNCGFSLPFVLKPELRNSSNIIIDSQRVMFQTEAEKYNNLHFGYKMREAVLHAAMSHILAIKGF